LTALSSRQRQPQKLKATLGEALSKLEQNGALATLLDTAPEDARKRLAASVQRSGDDRAKAALAKGVGGEVSKLMSGMITTDGDTKQALERIRRSSSRASTD
jgi:hypothetical protein